MAEMLALEAAPTFESALAVIPPPPPPLDDELADSQPVPPPEEPEDDAAVPKAPETKTLADLAHEVANWTLHSDHDLHAYLKRYSADLFARTKDLEDSVRDIAAEADSAHVRLKNTFNQFLMLSNNQFIENRVYDEEQEDFFGAEGGQTAVDKQEPDKEKEEQPAESSVTAESKETGPKAAAESIVNKYRSALDMGMEAMKLFVMMDDEDDTSETSSQFDTVLDIYNERPLPFIIGTREFLEDETLGLGAAPDDSSDSDSDSSYASSYSSSDSDSDSEESELETSKRRSSRHSEDSDGSSVAAPPPRRRADSDESDTSGLFGRPPAVETSRRRVDSDESSTSGLFGRPSVPESAPPASRHRPVFDDESDSDWTDSDEESKTPQRKPSAVSRREAPPPFAAPTLARKDQFLDSSDEESDAGLFGSTPTAKPRVFATDAQETSRQRPSLFTEQSSTSEELFAATTSTPKRRNSSKRLSSRRSDSFGSSDEEEELFVSGRETAPPPQGFRLPMADTARESSSREPKKSFLSSDSEAESTTSGLFGRPSSAKETKKPAAVSVLPSQPRRLDSDDSSDDDGLFGATPATRATPAVTVIPARRPMDSDSSSDDEDGGLFGATSKALTAPVPAPQSQPVQRSQSGLFGGDSDDSDSDDGGLFGTRKPATSAPVATPSAVRPPPLVTHDVSDSDSDSDDGGLFGVAQPAKPTPVAAVPITVPPQTRQSRAQSDSSDSDDGGLFGAPPVRAAPTPSPAPTPAPIAATTTAVPPTRPLINRQISSEDDSDDWSDDDGGLFGAATAKPAPVKPVATPTPVVQSSPAPTQTAASSDSLFGQPTGTAAVVHPPIPSAAARMRAAESSDSDSDSDWDGDGGLFGPPKKK
ncbi:Nucleoporin FG repeat region [Phytophthora infestans]|uniref:Nucleoporin FG repeat region n=1 Tax=Phytophthora infestans TaxID=4787 RepID=A0A833SVN7_PHYIN|nr:Nucleoporin FG repeat region [Phytophthora infestans]